MSSSTAAFFDLDKTIIARSSALAFTREFFAGGLLDRKAALRAAYAQLHFLAGGADHARTERLRRFVSEMTRGWPADTVREIVAETLHTIVDPILYEGAVALIEQHHAAGRDVVIVSASGLEVVEPIGELLGADAVIATRMEVVDGRYTGSIEHYVYAEEKAAAVRDLAERHGYDLAESFAYSDSVTDVPMLREVGHAFAVNPDKQLRRIADEEGWGVLTFDEPIALRRQRPGRPAVVTVGAATALAVGSIAYVGLRHRLKQHVSRSAAPA